MTRINHDERRVGRIRTVACALALAIATATLGVAHADTVRPEVGKPLQDAQALFKAQKYRDALAKVAQAEAVSGKTSYESYIIERTKGSIAATAGDAAVAADAFQAAIASGHASPQEKLQMTQAVSGLYYRAKDYAKAANWAQQYLKEGGTDPSMHTVLLQSYYLGNDCASISRDVGGSDTSGHAPSEEALQLLANCYAHGNDKAGYANAMERLVTYYPKKDYWEDLLSRARSKPGFSDRLDLDLDRLKLATGNISGANDYLEMTQLALQAGFSPEAKKIVDQGFASGALGTGAGAERHKRLRDLVQKQLEEDQKTLASPDGGLAGKDGDGLVTAGYLRVTAGQFDAGIKIMEKAIAEGGLKHPEDAKLHLGEAYILAGKKAKGREILRTVKGTDGTQDIARLWQIYSGAAT